LGVDPPEHGDLVNFGHYFRAAALVLVRGAKLKLLPP
jgi:hypothetical protein